MDRVAPNTNPEPAARPRGVPQLFPVVLVALAGAALVAAVVWWLRNGPTDGAAEPQYQQPPAFANWPKPDVALLLSGDTRGYLQPCGCSEPQKGGLRRRYVLLDSLRKK